MKSLITATLAVGIAAATLATPSGAQAEGRIRIVEQFGTVYLPLHVIRDHKLIEKHGKAAGVDIQPEWIKISGGAAINDALLSGSIDVGSAGIAPILTLWDKTKGRAEIKIIAALGEQPNYLITTNPNVKSLKDFTKDDRIALPAVGVSLQSRILQIAAEKEFGPGQHGALDALTVSLPHPDATAALLSGSNTISAHFSNPPFQDQVLEAEKVHRVLDSYEVLGGPVTGTLTYATVKFRTDNPKTFAAFLAALEEAHQWIQANRSEAAKTYVRAENSKLDPAFVEKMISAPGVRFTTTPAATFKFAEFLHRTGAIKNKPASWKDYVFEELHDKSGS